MYLILAILSTYRLARMLALEDGPFDLFTKWRAMADPDGNQDNWYARGTHCPLCIGFWTAALFAFILTSLDPAMGRGEFILAWFGIAGASTLLQLWEDK
jgi:hypothetical protein